MSLVALILCSAGLGVNANAIEGASSQLFSSQQCSANGLVSVTFNWIGNEPSAIQQWVDISLARNGWLPGTFISAGPLASSVTSYTWDGLLPNLEHYVRFNQQLSNGAWDASIGYFFLTSCGHPQEPDGDIAYRNQVTALLAFGIAALSDSQNTPPAGNTLELYQSRMVQICSALASIASSLAAVGSIPPRFAATHDNLYRTLMEFGPFCVTVINTRNADEFNAYIDAYNQWPPAVNGAINGFNSAVGVSIPPLR